MDIKQFVKESVSQIVEAINESNPKLQSIGSFIPTGGMIGEGVLFSANSEPSKDANKNDCEHTELTGAHTGRPKTYESFPEPPAPGIKTLYLSI